MPGARLVLRIARVLATSCPPITPIARLLLALSITLATVDPASALAQSAAANTAEVEQRSASETAPNADPLTPAVAEGVTV